MADKFLEFDTVSFIDVTGTWRQISGCPIKQRMELLSAFTQLEQRLQATRHKTFEAQYDNDPVLRAIAHRILELCRIDPDWLDIDMLKSLILHDQVDGQAVKPQLWDLNFQDSQSTGKPATYEEVLASMWNATGDLQAALQAAGYGDGEQLPHEQMVKTMIAKAEQMMTDEQRSKVAQERAIEERAARLQQQAQSQASGPRFATPEEMELSAAQSRG